MTRREGQRFCPPRGLWSPFWNRGDRLDRLSPCKLADLARHWRRHKNHGLLSRVIIERRAVALACSLLARSAVTVRGAATTPHQIVAHGDVAIGTKRTWLSRSPTSAFGSKADIAQTFRNVCFLTHSGHAAPSWSIQIMKLAIRLGLRAAHEEAFLDDLTVPDGVKPDLIEVHAFLALWRYL
jgi:hypothetical protein